MHTNYPNALMGWQIWRMFWRNTVTKFRILGTASARLFQWRLMIKGSYLVVVGKTL